jgi:hypothetical protein
MTLFEARINRAKSELLYPEAILPSGFFLKKNSPGMLSARERLL